MTRALQTPPRNAIETYPYESLFPFIRKPSRYIGGEWNSVVRDEAFRKEAVSFCLCFPDLYETGFANTGIEILYRVINARTDAFAERAYAADSDLAESLRRRLWPFFSLETRTPIRRFDLLGFALPYELCYTNILEILDLCQIPLKSCDRGEDFPLVIGGGPCVVNPEPLADFFDAFVIGDGEDAVGEIIEKVKAWKAQKAEGGGGSKLDLLRSLSTLPGLYVPALYEVTYHEDGRVRNVQPKFEGIPAQVAYRRASLEKPDAEHFSFPTAPVVPFVQTVHDRLNVEIQRGCPWRCRFCQAGFSYRPYRERTKEELVEIVEQGLRHTGYDAVTLAGLSAADHTEIVPLLHALYYKLTPRRISVGLPSTRADRFTLALAEILHAVRRQSLTFAPEAGTERMRRVIRKELQEFEVRETIRLSHKHGWKNIKLYFMYGLPTETWADLDGIVQLIRDSVRENRGLGFTLTLSPFVPKPHTPFQWHPQDRTAALKEKLAYLKKNLPAQIRAHELNQITVEGVLSRGDRRCGALLYEAWKLGSKFDEWSERFRMGLWETAFQATGLNPEFYCHRQRQQDEVLPWDHLQGGPDKRALWNDYQTSLRQSAEPPPEQPHLKPRPEVPAVKPVILSVERSMQRLRFRMSRKGPVRFLSHLEQIEMVRRMLRRANLPLAFSTGFHPQMKVAFGPAVSVGYESECELFDAELVRRLEIAEVQREVGRQAPEGFSILRVWRIPIFFPSLESLLNRVDYEVFLPASLLRKDESEYARDLERFLSQESLILEKVKKRSDGPPKVVRMDLKALLIAADWQADSCQGAKISMSLRFGPGKNVKPEKIVELFMGLTPEETPQLLVNRKRFSIEKPDGTLVEA